MEPKTWTDQPDEVVDAEMLGSISAQNHTGDAEQGEVRFAALRGYYITFGNLFGSQTILCADARAALELFLEVGRPVPKLPPRCKILANKEKTK